MDRVAIIGAGQLGSRHLQALKRVGRPLNIVVVDPSEASLKVAKDRYDSVRSTNRHVIAYYQSMPESRDQYDVVIVATNSDTRRDAIEGLLKNNSVRYMILEKLLFNRKIDYEHVGNLLKSANVTAWVNCSMRMMPLYRNLKEDVGNCRVHYSVTGSNFGLITNSIHYVDHISFLTGCQDFVVNVDCLEKTMIPSKRSGFNEINGTLIVSFSEGSIGSFTSFGSGSLPPLVQITTEKFRLISRENEGKAWIAKENGGFKWTEIESIIPLQSERTTQLVEEILSQGTCPLVRYPESARQHIKLFDALAEYLKGCSKDSDIFPFT